MVSTLASRTVTIAVQHAQIGTPRTDGGSIDDVIVGRQVTCYGRLNDKAQFMAARVEVRSR
jgi:hypothetical protein